MGERESFGDCVNIMVNTFKEDVEKDLIHMKILMQISKTPFNSPKKEYNDASTSKALEDEAKSSRRH